MVILVVEYVRQYTDILRDNAGTADLADLFTHHHARLPDRVSSLDGQLQVGLVGICGVHMN